MTLRLRRSTLRPHHMSDAAALARHADNRRVWLNLKDRFPHPYTVDDARRWIREARRTRPPTVFAIVVDGEACGGIGCHLQEDVYRRTALIGYWIGEAHWGRGIMTEAVRAFVPWIFEHFDVVRIEAGVFAWNPASMRVLEKAGFRLEARERRAVTKAGKTIDRFLYARTRTARARRRQA